MSLVKANRYTAYKDSGAQWLGEIPVIWKLQRHKDAFQLISLRCLNPSYPKVALENIEGKTGRFISSDSEFDGDGVQFKRNDILFGKLRPYLAKVYLAEFRGNAIGDIFVYRSRPKVSPQFAAYLMRSDRYIDVINSSTAGAKMPRASSGFIADLPVAIPSLTEQTAIAAHLDTKTAQIDRQIDLLGQKATQYGKLKQSLINETVTRGLDKSVPMKDSGVEWVGEIPEHWPVMRLKDVCSIQKGDVFDFDTEDESGKIPYFNGGMTPSGFSHFSNMPSGVIAVSEGGASSGYTQFMDSPFWCGAHCYAIFSKTKCKKYLYYCIKGWEHVLSELKTGSAMPNLKKSEISNFLVPITKNREEQAAITAYLDEKTAQIDRIVTAINTQIDKFKDLRKTLINDVVTGKIKVVSEGTGV